MNCITTFLLRFLGEPEVCDLGHSAVDKDVGQLHVPVQKLVISHLKKSLHNVLHEDDNFFLRDFALFLEKWAKISLVAVLSDDIAMGWVPDDIVAFEDIGVFEFGESLNLAI